MDGADGLTVRTFLLRGGHFNGVRITARLDQLPDAVVLFTPDEYDEGQLYKLTDTELYCAEYVFDPEA